jgi:hypothetical protein
MWVLVLKIAMHFGAWPLGLDRYCALTKGFNMFKVQRLIFPPQCMACCAFPLSGGKKISKGYNIMSLLP